jgi:hypothetical protein
MITQFPNKQFNSSSACAQALGLRGVQVCSVTSAIDFESAVIVGVGGEGPARNRRLHELEGPFIRYWFDFCRVVLRLKGRLTNRRRCTLGHRDGAHVIDRGS